MTTLTFWMKSGHRFSIPFVKNWKVEATGGRITSLSITRCKFTDFLPCRKLIVASIDLDSIEAITR